MSSDIIIRGIPEQCTKKDLENFLRQPLEALSIFTFDCTKVKGKPLAFLTFCTAQQVEPFLQRHSSLSGAGAGPGKSQARNNRIVAPLRYSGKIVNFQRSDKQAQVDPFHRAALVHEEKDRVLWIKKNANKKIEADKNEKTKVKSQQPVKAPRNASTTKTTASREFPFASVECGNWSVSGDSTLFQTQAAVYETGTIMFGKNSAAILIGPVDDNKNNTWESRIDIQYLNVEHVIFGNRGRTELTISLYVPPTMYRKPDLTTALSNLVLKGKPRTPEKYRSCGITPEHKSIAGLCFQYRINMLAPEYLSKILHLFSNSQNEGYPPFMVCSSRSVGQTPRSGLVGELQRLKSILATPQGFGNLPWPLKFQIEALAVNGHLPPSLVRALLPNIDFNLRQYGLKATTHAVFRLQSHLPRYSPFTEDELRNPQHLASLIAKDAKSFREEGSMYDQVANYEHIALIHRATVTPTGIVLRGPDPEPNNQVLRKYDAHTDYFLRVLFGDEDEDNLRMDGSSLADIYERYREVLDGSISIAGQSFRFLGFSHSSLRSHGCWFMAPFVMDASLIHATEVIDQLGDFSQIRSPAKCAARIGQAFSDTTGSIYIEAENMTAMHDVERNGRTFSDGVGTVSFELLRRIWDEYAFSKANKPTLLQIRYQGAKGMVSLDTRLEGEQIVFRPSMTKFHGSTDKQLGICGANFKPLPFYLNVPLIKILEDLGVTPENFLRLQSVELKRLQLMTISNVNAATYLGTNHLCGGQKLPNLLHRLSDIGLEFHGDTFLRDCIEMAALVQLRDIKYKAHIRVEGGWTLYGIMDETGILEANEIYCCVEPEGGGRQVLRNRIAAITRAPAMHPGDVQMVKCVDVPPDSPLSSLHNCVVFSQKGERDLPSMLSGGDLDGDLYNVIFDLGLLPTHHTDAAEYPRPVAIDIGRKVEREDMTKFFVDFMEQDQLGRISMLHRQVADRHQEGTFHPNCVKLAELASAAVDFSKTGIAANLSEIPRYDRVRPDFMAPGPRVHMTDKEEVVMVEEDPREQREDVIASLQPDYNPYKYYESQNVLGKLYRAIDESKFFEDMQSRARQARGSGSGGTLMDTLWNYLMRETALLQWIHFTGSAEEIRATYEDGLFDIMTSYSNNPRFPVTEKEVFSGNILGNSTGNQNRRTRELSKAMSETYEKHVTYIRSSIVDTTDDGEGDEALAKALACLWIGLQEGDVFEMGRGQSHSLESFKYVAAEVVLRELMHWNGGRLRRIR